MAALRYRDEHNKVSYLQKPTGSDDYHQILDFLRASHIRYALTNDPNIFDSLVKQGPPAILATIDETPYTITEDSVRSQLQLADDGGVDDLPIAEIYSEPIPEPMPAPAQPQDHLSTPPRQQTSDPFTSTNVEDEPLGGSFHASPPRSTQAPPTGHTSGGVEDLITLTVVSSVVSTLVQKVTSLETKLKDTKKLFKDVVGKLVRKVKAMEVKLKTKKRKVVVSDSDQEEGGEQAVDLDALIALANAAVTVDSNIPPGGASNNPDASSHNPTDVPTGGDFAPAHSTSPSRDPFKRKGVAKPFSPVSERTKKQLADERLSKIEAARLEAL
ncbi:hypothetical protein Tco_0303799 [Tanacetum coccineum]